jgi:hypothetical protein
MHRPIASRSWRAILCAAAAPILLLNAALPARAGLVLSVQDVSAAAGSSGNTLEVDLQNTGSSALAISTFSFELTVPGGSGISFQGADDNTALNPYIFATNSLLGPTLSASTGTTLDAGDVAAPALPTLAAGATVGLGRVFFNVDGSAPSGPVTVSINSDPNVTLLLDSSSNAVPIDTFNNGTITILSGGVVPEPGVLLSATLGFLGAARLIRSRRSTSR